MPALEVGYSPVLTRILVGVEKDIDVLFHGSVNERRARFLEQLRARGLKVVTLFGVYGACLDAAIARSRMVLNLRHYESSIFGSWACPTCLPIRPAPSRRANDGSGRPAVRRCP